jgi:cytochrome c-type biogenesis protein CcmH/NrfG
MQYHQVPKTDDQILDDQLASLTDQVLSGGKIEQIEMDDVEMERLQDTVMRIQNAFGAEEPDPAMAARIRTRLQMEWKDEWQLQRHRTWRWPQLALSGALLVLLLVSLALWGKLSTEAMPAAADYFLPWMPFFGVLCILLIVLLLWIDHRR